MIYQLLTNNINFSKAWRPAQIKSVNLAGGGEWRVENYRTEAGEEASWKDYDSTGNKDGGEEALVRIMLSTKAAMCLPLISIWKQNSMTVFFWTLQHVMNITAISEVT